MHFPFRYLTILVAIVWCCSSPISAQWKDIRFHSPPENQKGFSREFNAMLKDSKGNLWIGSSNGLYRFDGNHYYAFKKSDNTGGPQNNGIADLCEDKNGNIWGATQSGLFRYNPSSNQFRNYSTLYVGEGPGMENIVCDGSGGIWAGGIPGLLKYDPVADSFINLRSNPADKYSITIDRIRKNCMLPDKSGTGIWISTLSGLNYLDTKTSRITNHKNQPQSALFKKRSVRALATSPRGHYWMFDNDTETIIGFKPGADSPLYSIKVSAYMDEPFGATLFEDSQNRLWFVTLNNQVILVDYLHGNAIYPVTHKEDDPFSIKSDFFWEALEDQDGTIWLGTLAGISTCNTNREFYKYYPLSKTIPALQAKYAVAYLTENMTDSTWWIATLQGKAIQYHPVTGKSMVIDLSKAIPRKNGEMPGRFIQIGFFKNLILFNTISGTWQWEPGSSRPRPFEALPEPYKNYKILEMAVSGQHEYWFTDRSSLLYWNTQTQALKFYPPTRELMGKKDIPNISLIRIAPSGTLWMSKASGGLAWVKPGAEKIIPVPFNLPDETARTSFSYDYNFDSAGNLWFGFIGQGLFQYKIKENKFYCWNDSNQSGTNLVTTSEIDNLGHVWGLKHNEVSLFIPSSNSFFQFEVPYSRGDFSYTNFTAKLSNGHILANINGDMIEFIPEKVLAKPVDATPIISSIFISGKEQSIFEDSTLVLSPDDNFLTFHFGSLTDNNLFQHSIEYMLEGLDKKWKVAGLTNEAVYTQLPSGTYIFKVVLVGKNKSWRSQEKRLYITIQTPFYNTTWFRLLCLLFAGGILYYWYHERLEQQSRLYKVENHAQLLEKEKTQVQYENLKQHLNPHFLFNSLSSLSSLIEIDPKMAGKFLRNLSKTYRYIIQSKDKETVMLKDELDFVQAFVTLQKTRFENGLEVSFTIEPEYLQRHIVPVTMQNLIENAIKHNIIDDENILLIEIYTEDETLFVKNKMQLKKYVETSNKQGLESLKSLYTYLTERPFTYQQEGEYFIVKIPLL